jgi:hypothetical protein
MPYQVDDALLHAMSGTELSRVRTELRLLPEPNNQRLLMSRGADIVMQSSPVPVLQVSDNRVYHDLAQSRSESDPPPLARDSPSCLNIEPNITLYSTYPYRIADDFRDW